jgi:Transcriptional regulator, AbiEi antitoxin
MGVTPSCDRLGMDSELVALATTQFGLVTRDQAVGVGLSDDQIRWRVRSGRWERVQPRVYRIAGAPDTWEQRIVAAILSAGPGAVASHLSAGVLWGLRQMTPEWVEVTVARIRQPQLRHVRVHRVDEFPDEDRREVRGIPVTSVPRLLVDLSAFWSPGRLSVALDEMLRRRETSLWAVEQCVRRLESGPGRRCAVIEALVKERKERFIIGDSHLEQLVYQPLVEAGVELPVPQFEVTVRDQRFRLDFAWPDAKLYVEVDGFDTHRMLTDFHRDRRREALLVSAGWTPLHFTDRSPDTEIVDRVRVTLARLRRDLSA